MARRKEEPKKGILDRAIDALTTRDEKAEAEEAKAEAAQAQAKAMAEAGQRRAAVSRAKDAEARADAAEKAAAEAKAKLEAAQLAKKKIEVREALRRREEERAKEEAKTYVVKSGDSLSKIAAEVYGDAKRWPEIFEANKDKIKDPNLIHPGQEFKIP
jgi:nucleoid-associated protein YgaU